MTNFHEVNVYSTLEIIPLKIMNSSAIEEIDFVNF